MEKANLLWTASFLNEIIWIKYEEWDKIKNIDGIEKYLVEQFAEYKFKDSLKAELLKAFSEK